ncbi:hypothetical protein ZWY2020_031094 [Hordeum vulgare]|nr:hypothetical protein ZWY2020_031094 [Hordeum vulgare]
MSLRRPRLTTVIPTATEKMRRCAARDGTSWSTAASPSLAIKTPATQLEHAHLMPHLSARRALSRCGCRAPVLGRKRICDAYLQHAPDRSLRAPGRGTTGHLRRRRPVRQDATINPSPPTPTPAINRKIFTPSPVFADMVFNKYGLAGHVKVVNLSGWLQPARLRRPRQKIQRRQGTLRS